MRVKFRLPVFPHCGLPGNRSILAEFFHALGIAKHRAGNYCRSYARQSVVSRRETTAPTKDADTYFPHDAKPPLMEFTQLISFVSVEPIEAEFRPTELFFADLAVAILIASQDEDLSETIAITTAIRPNIPGVGCDGGRLGLSAFGMTGFVRRIQFFP